MQQNKVTASGDTLTHRTSHRVITSVPNHAEACKYIQMMFRDFLCTIVAHLSLRNEHHLSFSTKCDGEIIANIMLDEYNL